jgi:hypothetical protein
MGCFTQVGVGFGSGEVAGSKVLNEVTDSNTQSFGDTEQCVKADPLLGSFDFPDVNRMEIGDLGQFFLAHAGLGPVLPDRVPEDLELLRFACHKRSRKQEGGKVNTPNMGVFASCAPSRNTAASCEDLRFQPRTIPVNW